MKIDRKVALITGAAGFIGFHVARHLLKTGWHVVGIDNMSSYYDASLKESRNVILKDSSRYQFVLGDISSVQVILNCFQTYRPEVVIHLAAQAGVRYSLENPATYIESNVAGTFAVLEACREFRPKHTLIASTSSVYGANKKVPFAENDRADAPVSIYAATKKAAENLAHSYSHLFSLPITVLRFFTVYGPWGRPDMALFKFTKAMLEDNEIDIYNNGDMQRDFTYIDDVVTRLSLLISAPFNGVERSVTGAINTDLDTAAPFRILNLGNGRPESLIDFIVALEAALGFRSRRNYLPMQAGDVHMTWADTSALADLIGETPSTDINCGVGKFVEWYRDYYN